MLQLMLLMLHVAQHDYCVSGMMLYIVYCNMQYNIVARAKGSNTWCCKLYSNTFKPCPPSCDNRCKYGQYCRNLEGTFHSLHALLHYA